MVHIFFGTKLFGRVNRVPGLFYVATDFFHLWYCPVVPLASYLVVAEGLEADKGGFPFIVSNSTQSFRGVRIPFSIKSILLAWVQPILLLVWTLGGTIAIAMMFDIHLDVSGRVFVMAIPSSAFILWLASLMLPGRFKPSYERACKLAEIIQLDEDGWDLLKRTYGQIGRFNQVQKSAARQ